MGESPVGRPNQVPRDAHESGSNVDRFVHDEFLDDRSDDDRFDDDRFDEDEAVRPPEVVLPAWFMPVALTCILGPMAVAVVTALGHWWPSTVAVQIFGDGLFGARSLRWRIVWTFVLLGVAELAVLVPLAFVVNGARRLRRDPGEPVDR